MVHGLAAAGPDDWRTEFNAGGREASLIWQKSVGRGVLRKRPREGPRVREFAAAIFTKNVGAKSVNASWAGMSRHPVAAPGVSHATAVIIRHRWPAHPWPPASERVTVTTLMQPPATTPAVQQVSPTGELCPRPPVGQHRESMAGAAEATQHHRKLRLRRQRTVLAGIPTSRPIPAPTAAARGADRPR